MISKEEQLARESIIRGIDRTIEDLYELRGKVEKFDSLYESYFPINMQNLAIEYGKLVLLSMGYACQQNLEEKN